MKYFSIAVLAFVVLGASVLSARPTSDARALQIVTLAPDAFLCDGENHFVEIARTMRIRKAYVWYGMDLGGKADLLGVLIKVNRAGEHEYIVKGGWDHYADPTGIDGQTLFLDFAPDWIAIGEGESVRLYYQCHGFSEPTPNAKVLAVIYYLP